MFLGLNNLWLLLCLLHLLNGCLFHHFLWCLHHLYCNDLSCLYCWSLHNNLGKLWLLFDCNGSLNWLHDDWFGDDGSLDCLSDDEWLSDFLLRSCFDLFWGFVDNLCGSDDLMGSNTAFFGWLRVSFWSIWEQIVVYLLWCIFPLILFIIRILIVDLIHCLLHQTETFCAL